MNFLVRLCFDGLLLWILIQMLVFTRGFESYQYSDYEEDGSHRSRRSVFASYTPPQPSQEYPVIMFSDLNYNNATSNGYYHRLRHGEFRVWGRTVADRVRQFVFRSMLFLPNTNLTFKACCLAGNTWTAYVRNVENISNIHLWLFDNQKVVGGSKGIFYTEWAQWMMEFSMRADRCQSNCQVLPCTGACYFGTCGIDGSCQCTSGHSGDKCETRPSPSTPYPSIQYPLVLFPQKSFKGTPVKVGPDTFAVFAQNKQKVKLIKYASLRVLYARRLTFSRVDHAETRDLSVGSDMEDIAGYMVNNPDLADPLWFNYASDINLDFAVKVEDVPACTNCSVTGGCCYTGTCQCLTGYTGANCET